MTEDFHCGDHEALVAYLYDECEPGERERIAAHVASCAGCRDEVDGLAAARQHLATWAPPDTALGFELPGPAAEHMATVLRPAKWWSRPLPAWAQAAAAAAIFAAGMAIGSARGTNEAPAVASAPPAAAVAPMATPAPQLQTVTAPAPAGVTRQELAQVEQRLRAELAAVQRTAGRPEGRPLQAASAPGGITAEQVQALIDESEQRQEQQFALRTATLLGNLNAQRVNDMRQVQRAFGQQWQGVGAQVQQQREAINFLAERVSTTR